MPRIYTRKPLIVRFISKVRVNELTGCWNWTACIGQNGYGYIVVGSKLDSTRKLSLAHRVSWELHKGPVPEGLELDHLCRVRHCVNPDHLEPVTRRENILRGAGARTIGDYNGKKTHCIRGHAFSERNARLRPTGGRSCRKCARILARKRNKVRMVAD